MKSETYTCDECGKQKQPANQWWRLRFFDNALREHMNVLARAFILMPWDAAMFNIGDAETEQHLCSEACIKDALGKWVRKLQEGVLLQRANAE